MEVEPFGFPMENYRTGLLAHQIERWAMAGRFKGEPRAPTDFLKFDSREQTPQEQEAMLESWVNAEYRDTDGNAGG